MAISKPPRWSKRSSVHLNTGNASVRNNREGLPKENGHQSVAVFIWQRAIELSSCGSAGIALSELTRVAFGQQVHQLLMKIIMSRRTGAPPPLSDLFRGRSIVSPR